MKPILFALCAFVRMGRAEDAFLVDAPPAASDPGLLVRHLNLSTGRQPLIPAVLATVEAPLGFLTVLAAGGDTCKRRRTSWVAKAAGCQYAVNGGSFNMKTGACAGTVISGGTQISMSDSAFASWGLTRTQYVFGIINHSVASMNDVQECVSGFVGPLLIKDGQTYISGSTKVAPRTAVGIDAAARLLLLTVDGVESKSLGMNMTELAAAFRQLGAIQAVNLDGGGSTSAVKDGRVIDQPTCDDSGRICERAVSSIVCVKGV